MKTKLLLTAALIGAVSLSAHAGVRFGFSVGLPLPPIPVPVVTMAAPAPVVVAAPVVYAPAAPCVPAPVVTVTPPCPVVGYVWAPGYWSGRVWVGGYWHAPARVAYGHPYFYGHDHGWRR